MTLSQRIFIGLALTLMLGILLAALHVLEPELINPMSIIVATAIIVATQALLLFSCARSIESTSSSLWKMLKSISSSQLDNKSQGDVIAVLQQTQTTLKEVVRKESAAVENAADVICILDRTGVIQSVNRVSQSMLGYAPEELVGKNLAEFLNADDARHSLRTFLGLEYSVDRIVVENRFIKKSGAEIELLWSAHWSVSDNGLFCVAHDVTERNRVERLIRESEKQVRLLLEGLPAGVVIVDQQGHVMFMNATAREISGYEAEELAELTVNKLFNFWKDRGASFGSVREKLSRLDGLPMTVAKTGQKIPCEFSIREFDWNKQPCGLVTLIDIQERHEIEKAKRQFVAMIGHDLRGPLTAISAGLGFLCEGNAGTLNDRGKIMAQKAANQCQRLVDLVNDLLDLEKMRAGKFVSNLDDYSLLELARTAADVVEHSASSRKVRVAIKGDEANCRCDGARVIQVLVNLLDNAIKFSEPEQTVDIIIVKQDENNACTSVVNYGRLIPEEKLSSVFESFEQVKPQDKKERGGTGLGLAICKAIVDQHGGKIWVTSSAQEGTRFNFSLPLGEPVRTGPPA